MSPINNYLILTAIGPNRSETISELLRACTQSGCTLLHAKTNVLGQHVAVILFLCGNWRAIAKMEAILTSLEQRLGLAIQAKRTDEPASLGQAMTYTIQITAIDKIGILNGISDFLHRGAIPVEEISVNTYLTHTGTRMVSLHLKIHIPKTIHLATIREQFMTYCDDNNLDAFLEPLRN